MHLIDRALAGDEEKATEAFKRLDHDQNGQLNKEEFKLAATELIKDEDDKDIDTYVNGIFKKFDVDNNGHISIEEFLSILKSK